MISNKALLYRAFPIVLAVSLVVALAVWGEVITPVPPTESWPADVADSSLAHDPTAAPTEQVNPTLPTNSTPAIVGEGEFDSEDPSTRIGMVTSDGPGTMGSRAPELKGITEWLRTEPLTFVSLRGQVVLVDFWTYTRVNCIRTLPCIVQWHDSYAEEGLVIVGVHALEFQFEKKTENVVAAMERHGLEYPVVLDNDFKPRRSFWNRYWPTNDEPGEWALDVQIPAGEGEPIAARIPLIVRDVSLTPALGSRAPATDNRTLAEVESIEELTSWGSADPGLYQFKIPDTIEAGKRLVLTFSSASIRTSPICGPQADEVKELKDKGTYDANFIHAEVYDNPAAIQGNLADPLYAPVADAWGYHQHRRPPRTSRGRSSWTETDSEPPSMKGSRRRKRSRWVC